MMLSREDIYAGLRQGAVAEMVTLFDKFVDQRSTPDSEKFFRRGLEDCLKTFEKAVQIADEIVREMEG